MDLRLVEIFCHVYRARSFSRAAKELGLTQPTVSAHVKDLEATIGAPLFNRLGREIEPTEAGRVLYEHAKGLLPLKRGLIERMAQFLNRVEGELLVGASSVPGEYLLPGLVSDFQERHPGVRARLRVSDTAATLNDLRRGTIHIGVVGATAQDGDLRFEPFATDGLVLAVAAAAPWTRRREVTLRELRELPLLVREPGSGTRTVLERALAGRRLTLGAFRVAAELDSTTAIKQAIRGGHGVSFVSELTIASELESGTLRAVRVRELGAIGRVFYTVVDRRRELSPLSRAFLAYLHARRARAPRSRSRPPAR
jgi:DNA-binding transcriptional LysR family regulator